MGQTLDAIFEDGVFKPQQPVSLTEGQRVRLHVEALAPQGSVTKSARAILAENGLLTTLGPAMQRRSLEQVSLDDVRAALGRAAGKPLSEIIIEQRGPRL